MAFRYRLIVLLSVVWMLFAGTIGGGIVDIFGGGAWRSNGPCAPHQFEWECKPPDPQTGFGILLVPPMFLALVIGMLGWTVTGRK